MRIFRKDKAGCFQIIKWKETYNEKDIKCFACFFIIAFDNGNLKTTGNTLQDKLLSYGKSNSSWGLTIRDVLIDYCNEYGVAATSTYYVTNFDIFAEVGRNRPVIVFGYFPDSPGQVQSRGKVFHAVTAYGTSTSGLVTKLIVHYGWSGYSHVTLDGGLVGSSTQFVLN